MRPNQKPVPNGAPQRLIMFNACKKEYTLCRFVGNTVSWGTASTEEMKTDRSG